MPTDGTLIFDTNIDAAQFHKALQEMKKYADGVTSEISGDFTVLKGTLANLLSGAITGVTGQLSGLASSVMSTGMSFESSMSEVQALSGATAEEMQKLTDAAKEYGASTQYTASESAQALKYMALAGWDAEQSTAALPSVLNLAASAGMDLAQASDIVTDYVSAFGLEAADAAKLADELSYAQANSNTSVEQLSEAYKNCAANLNANGQSMETTTALLSMMANQGFKGAESGTALTAAMRDISNAMELVDGTTRQYAVSIGDTAIAVTDAEGNFRQLTDIYADVEKATDGMSEAERNAALSSVFTADSIKAANYVLAAGSDAAKDFAAALLCMHDVLCQPICRILSKRRRNNLYQRYPGRWPRRTNKKRKPCSGRAQIPRSALADSVLFFREDEIIQIGNLMLHAITAFPTQYMRDTGSNTRKFQ